MSLETITVNGHEYPKPSIDRMKRKQVKKLKPSLERLKNEDMDAVWEIVGLLIPSLSAAKLDDLELGECKEILTNAGIAKFDDDKAKTDQETPEGITPGESSASTNS
ncbi:hypothetical protein [Glutamicibacter creatinolyticus]|uniref:hypothetical protein n=1 Tax=Glutamicibacter creatinolyticus TaxID=162496 RepID=UPI003217B54E